MPTFEVELDDGRVLEVDADREPTADEIYESMGFLEDTGQGYEAAIASSAGRGLASIPKGIIGGVGALGSMIPGLEDNTLHREAKKFKNWYEELLPVNPALAGKFPVKAGSAVGQGVGFLGLTLGTAGLGAGAGAAQAVGLGTAGLMGSDMGAETAETYGVTEPWRRNMLILGHGLTEGVTESLGGIGGRAFTRSLTSRMKNALMPGSGLTRAGKTIGIEGVEEVIAGQVNDWQTKALVPEDPERPGFSTNGVPLPPEALTLQNLEKRLEEFALGGIGGSVFAGAQALRGNTQVSEALALRYQARAALNALREKGQSLTPEESLELQDLEQQDQNLSSWLERQGMNKVRPLVDRMVQDPTTLAEEFAKAAEARGEAEAAAFWRSDAARTQIAQDASEYRTLLDALEATEAAQDATVEEKEAARQAVASHALNSALNPLGAQSQQRAIDQTFEEQRERLEGRTDAALATQGTPVTAPTTAAAPTTEAEPTAVAPTEVATEPATEAPAAPTAQASPIEAALAAFGEGSVRASAERLAQGKEMTVSTPEAVAALRASPIHTFRENPDGSLTITGVLNPDTRQWVGIAPEQAVEASIQSSAEQRAQMDAEAERMAAQDAERATAMS